MTALDDAGQAALAAEQQALFGYGVLGPQLTGTDQDLAYACVGEHEALRDDTARTLTTAGVIPVSPRADYPSLYPVASAAAALGLALRLEEECARAWRYLYLQAASSSSATARMLRPTAQAALTSSAVRATRWRGRVSPQHPTTAFPGL